MNTMTTQPNTTKGGVEPESAQSEIEELQCRQVMCLRCGNWFDVLEEYVATRGRCPKLCQPCAEHELDLHEKLLLLPVCICKIPRTEKFATTQPTQQKNGAANMSDDELIRDALKHRVFHRFQNPWCITADSDVWKRRYADVWQDLLGILAECRQENSEKDEFLFRSAIDALLYEYGIDVLERPLTEEAVYSAMDRAHAYCEVITRAAIRTPS
jgi:hypothetical protein